MVGDTIDFYPIALTDASSQLCQGSNILEFKTPIVKAPIKPMDPNIILDYPDAAFTICLPLNVAFQLQEGNGKRDLVIN